MSRLSKVLLASVGSVALVASLGVIPAVALPYSRLAGSSVAVAEVEAAATGSILVAIVGLVLALGVPIICCAVVAVNAKKYPPEVWVAAGKSKVLWIVLSFVLSWIGLLIYFLAIHPKIDETAASMGIEPTR